MSRRVIAYALFLLYLPACVSWQVEAGVSTRQLIATRHPNAVRVTQRDGSHTVLRNPRIEGDSLSGYGSGRLSTFAVSDVRQVAIQKYDARKTAGLVGGICGGIAILLFVTTDWGG